MARMKPIAVRARELGAFINIDMEHFGLKELTLDLFKKLLSEPELQDYPHFGLVIQAYLRGSQADTEKILDWARQHGRQFTIRLVKGAYWDFEKVVAAQKTWEIPVFLSKPETDANYERITRLLLNNRPLVYPAFASHNVRSLAQAAICAQKLGLKPGDYEFQMLYGMAKPIRRALVKLGYRVREYCPVGELVPGMAYLVRRLLENTSNEGFLRAGFSEKRSITDLLRDPVTQISDRPQSNGKAPFSRKSESGGLLPSHRVDTPFRNEPPLDFAVGSVRMKMANALATVSGKLGLSYPIVIGRKELPGAAQMVSINPAHPRQVIGHVAQGATREVAMAVDTARKAFVAWSKTSAESRSKLLERLTDKMRADRYELAAWEILEVGKTWAEADADVVEAIDFCIFYAEEMRRFGHGRLTQ